jgi:hypothetical protein
MLHGLEIEAVLWMTYAKKLTSHLKRAQKKYIYIIVPAVSDGFLTLREEHRLKVYEKGTEEDFWPQNCIMKS